MMLDESRSVHGRVDSSGRLVAADPALADLHARAGGESGGPVAIPQLASLARLVRRLSIPVSRAVLAADGDEDLDLWVRAKPTDDGVAFEIAGWRHQAPQAPFPAPSASERDIDFTRAVSEWTWEADAALRLVALSAEGMAALSGPGVGPVLGDALTRLFVLEDSADGGAPILAALAEGGRFDQQYVTLRGTARRFRLSGVPLLDPMGRVTGFRGGGFAVDEADAAETDAAADGHDGAFAARLDQALRDPIHRIVSTAEQIREHHEGPLRTDYQAYAADIAHAGRHLLGLIDDLSDLEAVERADLIVEAEPLDLADVARRAAGLLSVRADNKDIRVEQPELAETLPATGDFRRALQILVNLIGNAVRYAPAGSTVRVSIATQDDRAAVIVADQGPGIAPADRERVFEKFERLGAREPGSGLGLYISRRLARAMGGDIRIEGEPGEGARVLFMLPTG